VDEDSVEKCKVREYTECSDFYGRHTS